MKRQKERARQEKQREKAERKRLRREEAKNRAPGDDIEAFGTDNAAAPTPEQEIVQREYEQE
jgi:hypothetical protein